MANIRIENLPNGGATTATDKFGIDRVSGNASYYLTANSVATYTLGTVLPTVQQYFAMQTLTFATNISWNAATQQVAKVTLTGNANINSISNLAVGSSAELWIFQDLTGNRQLLFNAFTFDGIPSTINPLPGGITKLIVTNTGTGYLGVLEGYVRGYTSNVAATNFNVDLRLGNLYYVQMTSDADPITFANGIPGLQATVIVDNSGGYDVEFDSTNLTWICGNNISPSPGVTVLNINVGGTSASPILYTSAIQNGCPQNASAGIVYLSADQLTATGDGTIAVVKFDTPYEQRGTFTYDFGSGKVDILATGMYLITYSVTCNNVTSSFTLAESYIADIDGNNIGGYVIQKPNPIPTVNLFTLSSSAICYLENGGTFNIAVRYGGSTKTVGILGTSDASASGLVTSLSVQLLGN